MSKRVSRKMEVLQAIKDCYIDFRYAPNYQEVSVTCGMSISNVVYYVKQLQANGLLLKVGGHRGCVPSDTVITFMK